MNIAKMAETIGLQIEAETSRTADSLVIECECGFGGEPESIVSVIEHALFDHPTRYDIVLARRSTLITAREAAMALDLEPRTESERKWREQARATADSTPIDWGITAPSPKITEH